MGRSPHNRRARAVTIVVFAISLFAPLAARSAPAVAVMPFKDLMQGRSSIGEAIRETVTTDLKDVGGLRVIERGRIDEILAEQKLQAQRADLDPATSVRVGKLLGAALVVLGSYQEAGGKVRLNARFVSVETGEIAGAAKVDGRASEFLSLQDRITAELVKSAGLGTAHVEKIKKRARPKLKSMKTVELYGQAVLAQNDDDKRRLLKAAVDEDAGFVYAARDLEELEKRLKTYDAAARSAQERDLAQRSAKLSAEKDPVKVFNETSMLLGSLLSQRRYKRLLAEARQVMKDKPPTPSNYPPGIPSLEESAHQYVIRVAEVYSDWDAVLREGEKFIAAHPGSPLFAGVRSSMDAAIQEKHFIEDGAKSAAAELAALSESDKKNPCASINIYTRSRQWAEAERELKKAQPQEPGCPAWLLDLSWFQVGMKTGRFDIAGQALERMRTSNAQLYNSYRSYPATFPVD